MTQIPPNTGNITRINIPAPILRHHQHIHLHADFFYVNNMPFLLTKSKKINFHTVQSGKSRSKRNIIDDIRDLLELYCKRGFIVDYVHGDNEFQMADLRSAI